MSAANQMLGNIQNTNQMNTNLHQQALNNVANAVNTGMNVSQQQFTNANNLANTASNLYGQQANAYNTALGNIGNIAAVIICRAEPLGCCHQSFITEILVRCDPDFLFKKLAQIIIAERKRAKEFIQLIISVRKVLHDVGADGFHNFAVYRRFLIG